jgi:hypothetical protein
MMAIWQDGCASILIIAHGAFNSSVITIVKGYIRIDSIVLGQHAVTTTLRKGRETAPSLR